MIAILTSRFGCLKNAKALVPKNGTKIMETQIGNFKRESTYHLIFQLYSIHGNRILFLNFHIPLEFHLFNFIFHNMTRCFRSIEYNL